MASMSDIAPKRRWPRFTLRQLFLATALFGFGTWEMFHLVTANPIIWIGGCVAIGATFGASFGILINAPRTCMALSITGWLALAIFAWLN